MLLNLSWSVIDDRRYIYLTNHFIDLLVGFDDFTTLPYLKPFTIINPKSVDCSAGSIVLYKQTITILYFV